MPFVSDKKRIAVIGAGIGGLGIADLLSQDENNTVTVYEKLPYLGGCSGTFTAKKMRFNAGAATVAGFGPGEPMEEFARAAGVEFAVKSIDPAMEVFVGDKTIIRYKNPDAFIKSIQKAFPHKNQESFWRKVFAVHKAFWQNRDFYYGKKTPLDWIRTIWSFRNLGFALHVNLLKNAQSVIDSYFPDIDPAFQRLLDNQIRIVAQADSTEINFATCCLALGYTFLHNGYARGGMGALFEPMRAKAGTIHTATEIRSITQSNRQFLLKSRKGEELFDNVFVNISIFNAHQLFESSEPTIANWLQNLASRFSPVGAFMVYLGVKCESPLPHHVQIIEPHMFPHCTSNSLFVSFSENSDSDMMPPGMVSITISVHTDPSLWLRCDDSHYARMKTETQNAILEALFSRYPTIQTDITYLESGTPKTWRRYNNRADVGGIPVRQRYFPFAFPSPDTPFEGLYLVGDTVFPGQGWPGVLMGAMNAKNVYDQQQLRKKMWDWV